MYFEAIARNKTPIKVRLLVRADISEDRKLLEVMRQAGVSSLSVGIECESACNNDPPFGIIGIQN